MYNDNSNINKNSNRIKKLVVMAMLSAIAFVVTVLCTNLIPPIIPAAEFLILDFKDAIIIISGFIFGPLESLVITFIVSFIEMCTVSRDGAVGFLMNFVSTGALACTAAVIYRKHRKIGGAIIGLVFGILLMTSLMLLWNYTITPIYRSAPRSAIADMLIPIFLPFNLLKGFINSALTLVLYKPVITALRKAKLMPPAENKGKVGLWVVTLIVSLIVIAACVAVILVINGKI